VITNRRYLNRWLDDVLKSLAQESKREVEFTYAGDATGYVAAIATAVAAAAPTSAYVVLPAKMSKSAWALFAQKRQYDG
jgi:hypothetical protein